MKMTEQHVSDETLSALIMTAATLLNKSDTYWYRSILSVSMELKQRRSEDKQREFDNVKA